MATTDVMTVRRKGGRPRRVPNERIVLLRVLFSEGELERVRRAAAQNYQSMCEFSRLAISEAAEESGAGPIVLDDRRSAERRRRAGDDQPVELERRKAHRRREQITR